MPLVVGAPLFLALFAASAFPWLLILRHRLGHLLAVPATAAGALFLFLVALSISNPLAVNYMATLAILSAVVGVLGLVIAVRTAGVFRRPGRYAIALWCSPLLGALVWIGTAIVAQFAPGTSRFGWVMNGDALNNLHDAGVIITNNGIALNAETNPVPLPAALIAAAIGAGAPSSGSASAGLAHQLAALTLMWVLLLAVFCVAIGVVAASLIPRARTRTVALVGALASLLPLTWFVAGLTIQWGYFNVDVVVPIALGAWLVYLGSNTNPVAALVILIGFAILAFATWTPIAILVVVLGVVLVIRRFRDFRSIRLRFLAPVLLAGLIAVFFALRLLNLGEIFGPKTTLSATGAGYTGFVNLWWYVPFLAAALVLCALLVRGRSPLPTGSGALGILIGGAIASGLLVYLASGGDHELFNAYYPKKFAWILLVLIGTLVLSFLLGAFVDRVRPGLLAGFVILALFASAILPPGTWPEVLQRQPIVRILGDHVRHDGESTVREILRLTSAHHPTVLWQSGHPDEPIVNEWLLLHDGFSNGDPRLISYIGAPYFLYRTSGRYSDREVGGLCRILSRLSPNALVVTANPNLQSQLGSTCPARTPTIRVTTSLQGTRPSRTGENWQSDGIEGPFR